jgi:serine/threonine-protein kinase
MRGDTMRMPELALPPAATVPLLGEGAALGVWRLCRPLHACDGGQWYAARHALAADRSAAVLVLHRSERAADVMLRYADQAGELGRLGHAGIAVPSDSGVTPAGQPYLIVDGLDGRPIEAASATLPLRERLQLVVQLCEALRYAHQQGWLLGALDPAMLWLDADQRLKLMGLDLACMPDPADPFERGAGLAAIAGYQAPERRGSEPPSLLSEVYGVGALLCRLVDGRLPAELGDSSADGSPSTAWPDLGVVERISLDALLRKAVAPLASRRHPSVEALADDLRAWLAGTGHSALALTPMPGSAAIAVESAVPVWPPAARWGRRWLLAGLLIAALAAAGLGRHFLPL